MGHLSFDVVTGAFAQTGHAIAARLLAHGRDVRTLTRAHPNPSAHSAIPIIEPSFAEPARLEAALHGCDVLYSTYWARYGIHGDYAPLVENLRILYDCARRAGVRRIVQVTVANIHQGQGIPYFDGKRRLEQVLATCGVPHSILRPTLLFGPDDTLVNNAAWAMRHLHLFPLPGGGRSLVRPAFVGDLADLAVRHGSRQGNQALDAVGPESYTFKTFVQEIRSAIGVRAALVAAPWSMTWLGARAAGWLLVDTPITRSEAQALRRGLFGAKGPATCPTRFSQWARANASGLGANYHSQRRRDKGRDYPNLGGAV